MKAKAVAAILIPLACVIACGSFGEGTTPSATDDGGVVSADANGGGDAPSTSDVAIDGPGSANLPKAPPICPLIDCPSAEPECKDEDCEEQASQDFEKTGVIDVDGTCKLVATGSEVATLTRTLPRTRTRTNVVLSITVLAAGSGDGIVMSVAIAGQPDGERVIVVRHGTDYELCEDNPGGRRCAPVLPVTLPATLHLWGVVTSESPPRAKFAFGTDCTPSRTIDLESSFSQGGITGSVGCVGMTDGCTMQVDDALLLLRAE